MTSDIYVFLIVQLEISISWIPVDCKFDFVKLLSSLTNDCFLEGAVIS